MPRCVKTAHVFEKKWRSDDVRLQEEASFASLLLPKKILLGLENAGYKTPSPIQLESIPVGRFGRDLLVQAKSGTGKTLVFTVIALESLSEIKYPQILIMAPTREIALQICDVVRAVGSSFKGLTCNSFIGGTPVDTDIERVHGCQIVIGTPGRLKHLITLGILPTNSMRLLVLDEADVLLESNFKDDLDYIFVSLPKEKQVIATSATYPRELKNFTRQYFRKVYLARLNRNELTLLGMVHYIQVLELSKMSLLAYKTKLAALEKVVTSVNFTQCLVFCNLISRVESLCYDIRTWGFTSTFISSAKEQCDRTRAIECLKRFKCKILVTSDVTSRGIDAENVDLVVNFDKPFSTEVYFHRCGRAGRYGAKGVAVTFLEKDEVLAFEQMKVKHNLKAYNLPDPIPANLINIRPVDNDSTTGNSEDDSSDEVSNKNLNDMNEHSSSNNNNSNVEDNISIDSTTVCNGKVSSNLNGHKIEENVSNKGTLSDKDINLKSSTPSEFDIANEKDCAVNNESNISSASLSEGTIRNGDNHIDNEISVTTEAMTDKNSFLEYLENGPKATESSSCISSISDSGVVNKVSADNIYSQELKVDTTLLGANVTDFQHDGQDSSEKLCLNNGNSILEADSNKADSKDLKQSVAEDFKENSEKLIPPSVTQEFHNQEENNKVLADTTNPTLPNTSESAKVSKEDLKETKTVLIPNKIQLSVGKFLMDNCDVNNLNSTEFTISSANETETEQDITKTFKDIRGNLTNFYSDVYKAYQTENLTDTTFETIKVLVMQKKDEEVKQSSEEIVNHSNSDVSPPETKDDGEKITTKTIHDELNKENGHNSVDLKSSDNAGDYSVYSIVSNESTIISKENNASGNGQVFERFVFRDSSTSSSGSESNIDLYLTLKDSFDSMKASEKDKSGTNLCISQKIEKQKCASMQKKKFFSNADKRKHSSPLKFSESSSFSSSEEDIEEQKFKHESYKHRQTEDKMRTKNKAKPCKEQRNDDKSNRSFITVSECSESLPNSQFSHNTSIPYSKRPKSADNDYHHNTNVAFSSHQCDYTRGTTSHGNIPSKKPPGRRSSAVNYGNKTHMSEPHKHTISAVNYGNIASTSQPREHNTNAANYGNFSSMNYHQECQLPCYPYSYQVNGYSSCHHAPRHTPYPYAHNHIGPERYQVGNIHCQKCNSDWYQMYMKQWQFIHSSLF